MLLNFSVRMGIQRDWHFRSESSRFESRIEFFFGLRQIHRKVGQQRFAAAAVKLGRSVSRLFFSSNSYPFFYFFIFIFYNQVEWKPKKVGQRSNCFRIQFFPPFVCLSKSRLSFVQIVSTFHSVCLASFSLSVLCEVGYWKQQLYPERASQSFSFWEPAWALEQWIVRKQGGWGNSRLCMILNVTLHARTMWWIDWGALT